VKKEELQRRGEVRLAERIVKKSEYEGDIGGEGREQYGFGESEGPS
jgi:hypothetical protein